MCTVVLALVSSCTDHHTSAPCNSCAWLTSCVLLVLLLLQQPDKGIQLSRVGVYQSSSSVEIFSYDRAERKVVFSGGNDLLTVLDVSDVTKPTLVRTINVGAGKESTSVAFHKSMIAVSVKAPLFTDPGEVHVYDIEGNLLASIGVGALPDSLAWTADGSKIVVAVEGEPSTQDIDGSAPDVGANPPGEIAILSVSFNAAGKVGGLSTAATINLQTVFATGVTDAEYSALQAAGMRVDPRVGGRTMAGKDMEPEYVTLSDDGKHAYVTIQENNVIVEVDLSTNQISKVHPLVS